MIPNKPARKFSRSWWYGWGMVYDHEWVSWLARPVYMTGLWRMRRKAQKAKTP